MNCIYGKVSYFMINIKIGYNYKTSINNQILASLTRRLQLPYSLGFGFMIICIISNIYGLILFLKTYILYNRF